MASKVHILKLPCLGLHILQPPTNKGMYRGSVAFAFMASRYLRISSSEARGKGCGMLLARGAG